jgi:hypothetical protein
MAESKKTKINDMLLIATKAMFAAAIGATKRMNAVAPQTEFAGICL